MVGGCSHHRHLQYLLDHVVRHCAYLALIIIQEDVWQLPQKEAP
jgi:hypothetical protein